MSDFQIILAYLYITLGTARWGQGSSGPYFRFWFAKLINTKI